MARHKVEIFTGGCPVCDDAVDLVKSVASKSCDLEVHDLRHDCHEGTCLERARKYGITRLPAVVMDGRLLDCCAQGDVSVDELLAAGIGEP